MASQIVVFGISGAKAKEAVHLVLNRVALSIYFGGVHPSKFSWAGVFLPIRLSILVLPMLHKGMYSTYSVYEIIFRWCRSAP